MKRFKKAMKRFGVQYSMVLADNKGALKDDAVGIMIVLVLAGLVLSLVYSFINTSFWPSVSQKLMDMMSFSG